MIITRLPPTYHQAPAHDLRRFQWIRLTADGEPVEIYRVFHRGCLVGLDLGQGAPDWYTVTEDAIIDRMDRR